ncbi:unnamed protein product, partial [Meganyctiphanes norvegica]
MEGKTARGASSPAKPALTMPEPLSTTRAHESSSHILLGNKLFGQDLENKYFIKKIWIFNLITCDSTSINKNIAANYRLSNSYIFVIHNFSLKAKTICLVSLR